MWGTFTGTLVNVRKVLVNMVLRVRPSSPNFARLRQSSHEGARVLLVHHGTCLIKGKVFPEKNFGATSAQTWWRKTA